MEGAFGDLNASAISEPEFSEAVCGSRQKVDAISVGPAELLGPCTSLSTDDLPSAPIREPGPPARKRLRDRAEEGDRWPLLANHPAVLPSEARHHVPACSQVAFCIRLFDGPDHDGVGDAELKPKVEVSHVLR